MATITSAQSGDFSDGANWVGGVAPTIGDVASIANNHIMTADADIQCDEIICTGTGRVNVTASRTITCNVIKANVGNGQAAINVLASTGQTVNILSDYTQIGSSYSDAVIEKTGSCTLNIVGNGQAANGVTAAYGFLLRIKSSGGETNITGNLTGSVTSGSFPQPCIYIDGGTNEIITVSGIANANLSECIKMIVDSTVKFTGTVTASGASNAIVSTNGNVIFEGIANNTTGRTAIFAPTLRLSESASVQWTFQDETGDDVSLYTASLLTGYPLEEDVEDGVIYGPSNEYEGTLEPVIIDTAQLASDLLDDIQTSSHVVAQRLRAAATDDSVGSIVTSTLGAP